MNRRTLLKALAFVPIAPVAAWAIKREEALAAREELADKIWMITPEETPFMSLVGKSSKDWPKEWQTDE